ncbi:MULTISPECIES: hypothetical protein [unclassified Methylophaga]|jgi:hypothetical protein|uniref:hypothetical protein n=1 Tax=unclassified Methylophaga TaxID=2629249 RepID=UPI000C8D2458|nr:MULTISPECIES: hypothetical protein [unclassified Methylophaga]MAK67843.1 hypothetical protein [Methylophaga sp.]MAY18524.1 hypothetical protein [Methylophaga sp.]|tara:strand:- start:18106 stop:18828 length:723 start_codon:yes stop_codon:yes gene_type:complete
MARRNNNQQTTTTKDALNYQALAFRDYLAARHLLIDDFLLQGIVLSSISVEKYLKLLLAAKGVRTGKHIDRLSVFKRLFEMHLPTFFDAFDEEYLWLLSRVYDLRYYDHIRGEKTVGFYKWQVLSELDYMVNFIESSINIKNGINEIKTQYSEYVENSNIKLFRENYIFNKINKKDFMERKGLSCTLLFDDRIINKFGANELIVEMQNTPVKYDGVISLIRAKFNKNQKQELNVPENQDG